MTIKQNRLLVKFFARFASIGAALATGVILMARNDERQPASALIEQSISPLAPVLSTEYSFDGKRLLIGYEKNAYLWDIETGKELQRFQGHTERVLTVALSPDRKYALTGGGGGCDMGRISTDDSARLWDVATGKEVRRFEGHKVLVHNVQFSPDSKRVLTASADGTARLWDALTGHELFVFTRVYTTGSPTGSVSFSPDGRNILGSTGGHRLTLWDAQTGKALFKLERSKNGFYNTAVFDPSGKVILTASSDGMARTWDAKTGRLLKKFSGHTSDYVQQAIFTADGRTVVTACADKTVRLWNANTGKEIKRINYPGKVQQVLISRDGKRLFAKWQNENPVRNVITLSDAESGRQITQRPDMGVLEVVGFSPDGKTYLIAKEGKPDSLWDATTGKMLRQYKP